MHFSRNLKAYSLRYYIAILILAMTLIPCGCEKKPAKPVVVKNPPADSQSAIVTAHEDLDATLWMRTSAEYHVLCVDAYRRALTAVGESVKDPTWSALPDQLLELQNAKVGEDPKLPAVILDVDETVLDNSAFQVENITTAPFQFSGPGWKTWCEREMATPIPGVIEFIQGCRDKGVAIRYVTNRGNEVRAVTLNNLRKHGLVPDDESAEEELLCKGDKPEWGSDKTNRREFVANQFRVVALIGDDLNDFLWAGQDATPEQRLAAASTADTMWGTRWFLLPNANYGGWEKAIQEYKNDMPRDEYIKMKMQHLVLPALSVDE